MPGRPKGSSVSWPGLRRSSTLPGAHANRGDRELTFALGVWREDLEHNVELAVDPHVGEGNTLGTMGDPFEDEIDVGLPDAQVLDSHAVYVPGSDGRLTRAASTRPSRIRRKGSSIERRLIRSSIEVGCI